MTISCRISESGFFLHFPHSQGLPVANPKTNAFSPWHWWIILPRHPSQIIGADAQCAFFCPVEQCIFASFQTDFVFYSGDACPGPHLLRRASSNLREHLKHWQALPVSTPMTFAFSPWHFSCRLKRHSSQTTGAVAQSTFFCPVEQWFMLSPFYFCTSSTTL